MVDRHMIMTTGSGREVSLGARTNPSHQLYHQRRWNLHTQSIINIQQATV